MFIKADLEIQRFGGLRGKDRSFSRPRSHRSKQQKQNLFKTTFIMSRSLFLSEKNKYNKILSPTQSSNILSLSLIHLTAHLHSNKS